MIPIKTYIKVLGLEVVVLEKSDVISQIGEPDNIGGDTHIYDFYADIENYSNYVGKADLEYFYGDTLGRINVKFTNSERYSGIIDEFISEFKGDIYQPNRTTLLFVTVGNDQRMVGFAIFYWLFTFSSNYLWNSYYHLPTGRSYNWNHPINWRLWCSME